MFIHIPHNWWVVVAYDGPYGAVGKVLSRHLTHKAARKAAKPYGNWVKIEDRS